MSGAATVLAVRQEPTAGGRGADPVEGDVKGGIYTP